MNFKVPYPPLRRLPVCEIKRAPDGTTVYIPLDPYRAEALCVPARMVFAASTVPPVGSEHCWILVQTKDGKYNEVVCYWKQRLKYGGESGIRTHVRVSP